MSKPEKQEPTLKLRVLPETPIPHTVGSGDGAHVFVPDAVVPEKLGRKLLSTYPKVFVLVDKDTEKPDLKLYHGKNGKPYDPDAVPGIRSNDNKAKIAELEKAVTDSGKLVESLTKENKALKEEADKNLAKIAELEKAVAVQTGPAKTKS